MDRKNFAKDFAKAINADDQEAVYKSLMQGAQFYINHITSTIINGATTQDMMMIYIALNATLMAVAKVLPEPPLAFAKSVAPAILENMSIMSIKADNPNL